MPGPRAPRANLHSLGDHNHLQTVVNDGILNTNLDELFLDPMQGIPLSLYVDKDVHDRANIVRLIKKHGGTVTQSYSGVSYILVDPFMPSGQNLYRQYATKKTKTILDARWVHECIKAGKLQTYASDWAGCKVVGNELATAESSSRRRSRQNDSMQADQMSRQIVAQPTVLQPTPIPAVELVQTQTHYTYQMYDPTMHATPRAVLHAAATASVIPPMQQTWQGNEGIAPQQTHMIPLTNLVHRTTYREDTWANYDHDSHAATDNMVTAQQGYDYRYREDPTAAWVAPYYDTTYDQTYDQSYIEEPNATADLAAAQHPPEFASTSEPSEKRGRKRNRISSTPAIPTSLVPNRNPHARSPSPPSRVIKSTYGGNLFTAEDIEYLKSYIKYCQEQGLVLSLREICERIAVKAPHHTFYSWRRYCNKHHIKLDGYVMNRSESPNLGDGEEEENMVQSSVITRNVISMGRARALADHEIRDRSPTPPRALFRSTTGKGVAFTEDDVAFLLRFMQYRSLQGEMDMVAFWKEVATKAPHHSRASWMKFWRRHNHELNHNDPDDPLPQRPDKKMRYSQQDDISLARYLYSKPEGTMDKIFQTFAILHPHHPWKGWQEHHRIHKAKIDYLISRLEAGASLDDQGS
ncbi:hypothetical protein C8J56DRAFT_927082 [Mycena floridula]|nr:hypothetical protein C8J56DRAFT_927082 [Mycena floridula]